LPLKDTNKIRVSLQQQKNQGILITTLVPSGG